MAKEDFEGLPDDDLGALRPFATRHSYSAGTTLFRQGDPPKALLVLERGEVELVYQTRSERLVVQILYAGSSVDHLAILLGVPYHYSAVTLSESTLLRLRLDTVRTLEQLFPEIAFRWVRLLAHALDRAHQRLLELAGRSALEQVSHLLLHEAAEREEPVVELTQEELAAALALSRQTVSRALRVLADEHVIRQERRRIRVLDLEELRARLPRDALPGRRATTSSCRSSALILSWGRACPVANSISVGRLVPCHEGTLDFATPA
jgi:CRP-like cAMP-binding protein